MFNIVTSRDFLAKLEADYTDFKAQPDSARHALNCIITAYHLHEWVWGDWLNTDYVTWKKLGIRNIQSFEAWLDRKWPAFGVVQKLTNGTKHLTQPTSLDTERIAGYGTGPYGVGPYGQPYLLIDYGLDHNADKRFQTAEQLLHEAVTFWRGFFDDYSPEPPQR